MGTVSFVRMQLGGSSSFLEMGCAVHVRSFVLCMVAVFCVGLVFDPADATVVIHHWSKDFGDSASQDPGGVAVDAAGNVYITGYFWGTMDFGGGPLTSAGASDIYVAKFSPSGVHLWSKSFGDGTDQQGYAVAANTWGDVLITGYFAGSVDFGGGTLTGAADGAGDVFVAKFDTNGNHLWSQVFGDFGNQNGTAVAFDNAGNMLVGGTTYTGSVDFGGGPLPTTVADGWIVKFDASGAHVWSRRIGDVSLNPGNAHGQAVNGVAVDTSGNAIITGTWGGTVDFGAGPIVALSANTDLFIAKYGPGGAYVWNRTFGDATGYIIPSGCGVDGSGNAAIAGYYAGTIDFGGGPISSPGSNSFLVSFDSGGAHRWSSQFGGDGGCYNYGIGVNAAGDVSITGQYSGTVDFGGGPLTTSTDDIFVAKYNASGVHRWSRGFPANANGWGTVLNPAGDVYVTGNLYGAPVDFGGGPLTAEGYDVFLAKFGEELPVATWISSFDAVATGSAVEVRWELRSYNTVARFTLSRREDSAPQPVVVTEGSVESRSYSYIDRSVEPGKTYHYELLVDTGAGRVVTPIATVTTQALAMALGQNYPNPFNPTTTIEYTVSKLSSVTIGIYNAAGTLVVRLDDGVHAAGTYHVTWNGRDATGHQVGSGVYSYRLEGLPGSRTRKMLLVK